MAKKDGKKRGGGATSKGKGGGISFPGGKVGGTSLLIALVVLLAVFWFWKDIMKLLGMDSKEGSKDGDKKGDADAEEEEGGTTESMRGAANNRKFRRRLPKKERNSAVEKVKREAKRKTEILEDSTENMRAVSGLHNLDNDHVGSPYPSAYQGNVSTADSNRLHIKSIDSHYLLNRDK